MKELIKEKCKEIEKVNDVKILFAIESGSRVWGMESKDSDYDVRYVYHRPVKEYIKINKNSDTITTAYDKEGKQCRVEGSVLDMLGFDIFKFCSLLYSSNPTSIEWLRSNILYYGKIPKELKDYSDKRFSPKSLYYHYKSMCRQNYLKYIKSKTDTSYKKYLYSARGAVNSLFVKTYRSIPPINFFKTLMIIADEHNKGENDVCVPKNVIEELLDIIEKKKSLKEKDIGKNISQIDEWIEGELAKDECPEAKGYSVPRELNEYIQEVLI